MSTSARPVPSVRLVRGLLMTLLCCAAVAPTSAMASGDAVLVDCVDGALKPSYSIADYREALEDMPTDLAEYTDCPSQIRAGRDRALAAMQAAGSPYVGRSKATSLPATGGAETTGGVDHSGNAAGAQHAGAGAAGAAPTSPPVDQPGPTNDEASDADLLALPAGGGGGDGPSAGPDGASIPMMPAVIAISVIVLTAARGLVAWSQRPERLDADTSVGTA